jgi:hypothetical protein
MDIIDLAFLIKGGKKKAFEPQRPGHGVVWREAMGDVDLFVPGQGCVAFLLV